MIPLKHGGPLSPADIENLRLQIQDQQATEQPFDIAIIRTHKSLDRGSPKGIKKIQSFQQAGMTWWLDSLFIARHSTEALREAIRHGPPA